MQIRKSVRLGLVAATALGTALVFTSAHGQQLAPKRTQSQPAPAGRAKPTPLVKSSQKTAQAAPIKTPGNLPVGGKAPVTETMAPVIVTAATRDAQPVDTTATSTTVLTNDFLQDQNYSRAADALAQVPGLAVVTSGTPGQVTSVFSRGTNSDQTLLTIDGRRQAPDFSNFYDITNLTLDNVDQVEVVRTPSSSVQGANAIGGVINLATLSGRGLTTPESSVGFEAGSFDTFREFAQTEGAYHDFDYAAAFSQQDSHFPEPNNSYSNTAYRGNYGYAVTPSIYVDLQTSYTSSHAGDPGQLPFLDPTAFLDRETWNLSPRIGIKVADFYTSTFYYNHTQLREVSSDPLFDSHNRSQIDTDSIDWQNDLQLARNWKITAGLQGDHYDVSDYDDVAGDEDIDQELSNIGGYVQSQWQPLTGLNVVDSMRYDAYSQFDGAFSWRQGVSYQTPVTATVLHGSVASAYETPTVEDLYSPGFFGFGVGNPNLKPEKDFSWELGADQPLWDKRLDVNATYFHNDLRDLIDDIGPFFTPTNVGSATTQGAEIGVTARPWEQFTLNANYTYLSALDDTSHARLLRRPRDSFNFTATYRPIAPVTLSLGGSWVVDRDDVDNVAPYGDVQAPNYFVLRGNASWRINDHVTVWLRGENLTGASYQPVLGYPALGMAGYGGVKVSF